MTPLKSASSEPIAFKQTLLKHAVGSLRMNGGKSHERRQFLYRATIGPCDKSHLLFSCL